ncbi:hypothetical protein [Gordonia malaquae]|uniref:hypothetical protein n=1 Tax=Gordonia malaquae TaxID=410332 RepID=UPI0030172AE2
MTTNEILDRARRAIGDDGTNDDEHEALLECIDEIERLKDGDWARLSRELHDAETVRDKLRGDIDQLNEWRDFSDGRYQEVIDACAVFEWLHAEAVYDRDEARIEARTLRQSAARTALIEKALEEYGGLGAGTHGEALGRVVDMVLAEAAQS